MALKLFFVKNSDHSGQSNKCIYIIRKYKRDTGYYCIQLAANILETNQNDILIDINSY